jgi:hypothetical protein
MDQLGYADGYFIEVVDSSRPVTAYICDGRGQTEIDTEPCLQVHTESRCLLPLLSLDAPTECPHWPQSGNRERRSRFGSGSELSLSFSMRTLS